MVDAGICGTDGTYFVEVEDDTTNEDLDRMCWDMAVDNAEMYGIYNRADYENSDDYDEDDESYSDNIEGYWEDYDSIKHDDLSHTGTPDWQ
jgi:hypothetical protein